MKASDHLSVVRDGQRREPIADQTLIRLLAGFEKTLAGMDARLTRIETLLHAPSKQESLAKERFSVLELAELTEAFGVKSYAPYTIRRAAAVGRIPDAQKLDDNKTWFFPKTAVYRILEEGIPPERRSNGFREFEAG